LSDLERALSEHFRYYGTTLPALNATRYYTGRSLLRSMLDEPLRLPNHVAMDRLSGWALGPDKTSTCAILMLDSTLLSERNRALQHVDCCALWILGGGPAGFSRKA